MRLAVIIPLDSAPRAAPSLATLVALRRRGHRVILVNDGTAHDVGPDASPAQADRCVFAPAGWSRQINAGSRAPEVELADALVFLPAGVQLPPQADRSIARALANSTSPWGRFDIRYRDGAGLLRTPLAVAAAIANFCSRLTGICLREQAVFVTRGAFLALGGLAPLDPRADRAADSVADADFSRRARLLGPPIILRDSAVVPAPAGRLGPLLRAVGRRERARWAMALGLAGGQH
jgi:hypothetical protein